MSEEVLKAVLLNSNITAVPTMALWEPHLTLRGHCLAKPTQQGRHVKTQWARLALSVKTLLGNLSALTHLGLSSYSVAVLVPLVSHLSHSTRDVILCGVGAPCHPPLSSAVAVKACTHPGHTHRGHCPLTIVPPGWGNYSYLKCPHLEALGILACLPVQFPRLAVQIP